MLSVLLSLLIAMAQVVFCPGPGCQFVAADRSGPGPHLVHPTAHGAAALEQALASLGHAAIEAAFSGVVRVGDGPAARSALITREC